MPTKTKKEKDAIIAVPDVPDGKTEIMEIMSLDFTLVYFDFETTGLSPYTEEIVQIGTAAAIGRSKFDLYILPTKQFNPIASGVTGLSVKAVNGQRRLFYKNRGNGKIKEVKTVDMKEGVEKFLNYLTTISGPIVLIGHNVNTFDMSFLFMSLIKLDLIDKLLELVIGVIDTKVVFKKAHPELQGGIGYRQDKLYQKFVGKKFNAHNAVADVTALKKLVTAAGISKEKLVELGFTNTGTIYDRFLERRDKKFGIKNL